MDRSSQWGLVELLAEGGQRSPVLSGAESTGPGAGNMGDLEDT